MIKSSKKLTQKRRILYTCHEGCNPLIWQWCEARIKGFSKENGASLIELPKSKLRNPQWVLFDAMRHSIDNFDRGDFAWIDSDIVVMEGATDIWSFYTDSLVVCLNGRVQDQDLLKELNLPTTTINLCTGVVRWSRDVAIKIIDWLDSNIENIPKIKANRMGDIGDQEVLIMALNATGQQVSFFHRSMHVAGSNPPIKTSFKHKGGMGKLRDIPRFLEMNEKFESQVDPYSTHSEILKKHAKGDAIEFGCGNYSTLILLDKCDHVTSVEMQDARWLTKVKALVGSNSKWRPLNAVGAFEFRKLKYASSYDVGFVDGHGESRYDCVNFLMDVGVPIIIAHDTEASSYKWNLVQSKGYTQKIHKELRPWTTVWTKDPS